MMRRALWTLFFLVAFAAVGRGQSPLTYEGYYDVQLNDSNSTYDQALTHRHRNGQLTFLTLTLDGKLREFALPAMGAKQSTTIRSWSIPGTGNFTGIWFEEAKDRLWVTSAEDYTNVNRDAKVTLVTLHDNGTTTMIGQWSISGVGEKKVYGGVQPSPLTPGKYVVGWGGYTSLVMQGSVASMGPTMFEIPEPTSVAGALPARTILNTVSSRGKRLTIPVNYFDSGDPRQNPSSRPTSPPLSTAQWLSPGPDGKGWFVWGDSYYNTGNYIPGLGFVMVASLCKGSCWYQSSTLAFDGRQFELHVWPVNTLGSDVLSRPSTMVELTVPRGNTQVWGGNSPTGNLGGATYDEVGKKFFAKGCPFGPDVNTCRVYQWAVNGSVTPQPPPPPTPVDATVSAWSAWSACTNGQQTRTRTVLTPASNGGLTPPLSESQACAVTPPPPPPPPVDPCVANPGVLNVSAWPSTTEGSRRLTYSYTVAGVVTTVAKVEAQLIPSRKITVTDARGCVSTMIPVP